MGERDMASAAVPAYASTTAPSDSQAVCHCSVIMVFLPWQPFWLDLGRETFLEATHPRGKTVGLNTLRLGGGHAQDPRANARVDVC